MLTLPPFGRKEAGTRGASGWPRVGSQALSSICQLPSRWVTCSVLHGALSAALTLLAHHTGLS